MTDENDDRMDLTDILSGVENENTAAMGGMFGPMLDTMFSTDTEEEPSEEVKIAIRMIKAGDALKQFVEYVKEEDLDIAELDPQQMRNMDYEHKLVILGFMSMNPGLEALADHFEQDDGDNPFKVSDGDDPVY